MKSAGFFWFQSPNVQHHEGEGSEGKHPEESHRKPVEKPETRPRCGIVQEEGTKRLDFGSEEEPGEEATEAHKDRERGRPKPPAKPGGNAGKGEACPHACPVENRQNVPHQVPCQGGCGRHRKGCWGHHQSKE
jgi:hypothetical protein